MMGITKQKLGNEHKINVNKFILLIIRYFRGLFVAFTYNKKQPPAFGAALAFWCILLPFFGLSFRHIPNNLSNYNVLTANAPFFYQISGDMV
ncbi:putative cytochrome c biosynthesis protein [Dioscorea sansibarensis]